MNNQEKLIVFYKDNNIYKFTTINNFQAVIRNDLQVITTDATNAEEVKKIMLKMNVKEYCFYNDNETILATF